MLTYVGKIGPLPYFTEDIESSVTDDGIKSIKALIETYIMLEPHSRPGFRLALVNPPDAGRYLSLLSNLAEEGMLDGAHLTLFRHPKSKIGVELHLDEAYSTFSTNSKNSL